MWLGPKIKIRNAYLFYYKKFNINLVNKLKTDKISICMRYSIYYFILNIPNKAIIRVFDGINMIKIITTNFKLNFQFISFLKKYLISSLFKYFFNKITFKGKGYYLYKNKRNVLALQFNYSHKVNVYFFNIFIKNYSKTSWLFYNLDKKQLVFYLKLFKQYRPINIFTQRGIRFRKEIVYVKQRKK